MQNRKTTATILIALFSLSVLGMVSPAVASSDSNSNNSSSSPPIPPGMTNATIASSPSSPAGALTWSAGAYPVVNGQTAYPPLAIPESSVSPDNSLAHWYAGSTFTGTAASGTWIFAQIKVPNTLGLSDEFYYVLASIWDNSGSYDQIAYSNDYGVWGLTYSYTTGPCSSPTYVYSPDAMNLKPGVTYKFYITTQPTGLWFEAYKGTTLIWSLHANSVVTTLNVGQFYCGYYNYTDYVENWYSHVAGGYPSFTFTFKYNQFFTTSWIPATWGTFSSGSPPHAVKVTITGQQVVIKH